MCAKKRKTQQNNELSKGFSSTYQPAEEGRSVKRYDKYGDKNEKAYNVYISRKTYCCL